MTTAHAVSRRRTGRKAGGVFVLPLALLAALVVAAGGFVSYVLWPRWPTAAISPDAPSLPVTIAGVLFNVPPAAIRTAVQRHAGAHERIDLAFLWPSLAPPRPAAAADEAAAKLEHDATSASGPADANKRLFVTIIGLDGDMPPAEQLRAVYPRYVETQATAGADGLAVLPFRVGTPYEGEDLVYLAANPEQFFARCTRQIRALPGICIHKRALDRAEMTLRFPRQWLQDWRSVAAGFDRLIAQLRADDRGRKADDR